MFRRWMSPLDQLWDFFSTHATAFGVIVAALVAFGGGIRWLLSRKTDPPSGGGEIVHGPKVGGNVDGDTVGRDKITVHGDQVGRDRAEGDIVHGDKITQIIHQLEKTPAKAAGSRFQLPARNPDFVGRRSEIEEIKAALRAGAAHVTALEGMGGIGKTDTAVEAAHELVDEGRFKDAQLSMDLQGFSATGHPLAPVDALRALLRPFVPADETLPEGEQDLAGRFREVTHGLDMLLFLDNARDDAQVRPLLPGHRSCTALITSRNRLSLPGLRPIDLDEMHPKEAATLAFELANRRYPDRITPAQAEQIAHLCGYLPISIEVTANALSKSRGADVAGYVKKLGQRTKPLKALEKAKEVLRLSMEALDEETRARWQAVGVFEGGLDAAGAAAVWAVEDAGVTLEELEERSLVRFEPEAQRYGLHDLPRAMALEELARDPARQHETLRRHAQHYFAVLRTADALYNAGHDDVGRGLALLDSELTNIRAAQRWAAAALAADERAAWLAQEIPLHACLRLRLPPDEHLAWLETSHAAAELRCDRKAQAAAAGNLAAAYARQGESDRAQAMHTHGLAIDQELGHKSGMASKYGNRGVLYAKQGRLDRAEEELQKSLAIYVELEDEAGMAIQYGNVALVYKDKGELDCAEEMLRKGLAINEQRGHKDGAAVKYGNLGSLYGERGDMAQAVAYWQKSLALYREIGARKGIESCEAALRDAGVDPDRDVAVA